MDAQARTYVSFPRVLLGAGAQEEIGRLAAGLGARRVLVVSDPFLSGSGAAAHLADLLGRQDIGAAIFDEVAPNPTVSDIDRCSRVARDEGCDAVIGLGGGSALDVAKGVALTAPSAWRFEDLLQRGCPPRRLPDILVPSTSGSGSEVSQAMVVMADGRDHKMGLHAAWVTADVAVIDPGLTASMPPSVTADTGLDALAHGIEALLARNASPPSDALAQQACSIVWQALPVAFAQGGDLAARESMCTGAMLAGMAFTWAGLGAVHALAYPLTLRFGLSHGRANAVVLPHVLRYTFAAVPGSSVAVADALGLDDDRSQDRLVESLAAYIESFGISVRLRDVGVNRGDLVGMASEAIRPNERLLATNPCAVTEPDAIRIYTEAW